MACRKICHRVPRGCHPKRRGKHRKGKKARKAFSKKGYKKCIVNAMQRTKFKTPLQARKAYSRAAKKCRKLFSGKRRVGGRKRKHGRRRRTGISWQERRAVGMMPGAAGAFAQLARRR